MTTAGAPRYRGIPGAGERERAARAAAEREGGEMSAVSDDRYSQGPDDVAESLLAAAFDLFSERGPANVSVRQVAQAAGVNPGLVHHYFPSKDDLVGAVLDRSATAITDALGRAGDGSLLPLLTE